MASVGRKGGGDFVLESRHLVGLFLLLVVIFGAVFTLGYLMGRSQYDSRLRAAVNAPNDASIPPVVSKPPVASDKGRADWEFYHSAEPKSSEDHLLRPDEAPAVPQPAALKPVRAVSKPLPHPEPRTAPPLNAPLIPSGSIMVQVAAVASESDALALAQALQQKKFPAFVIPPGADKYYRVQVGPYRDAKSATAARRDLEEKGFKSIIKR